MTTITRPHMDELSTLIGAELGVSRWITLGQEDNDLFARATRDPDPLHIDPDWARREGPFGGTIIFGFLTLGMLTHLANDIGLPRGSKYQLNYGLNRVRFVSPVHVGARVRLRMALAEVRDHSLGLLITNNCTIEIEGSDQPAIVAEWLGVLVRED